MREIKFRGLAISDSCGESVKKMVYGDLTQTWNKVMILDWDDGDIYEVEPKSAVQLVGYDAKGNEVYEGDELITPDGTHIYAAICCHAKIAPAKDFDFSEEAKRDGWMLKTE